jgi:hypothetical protein
MSDTETTCNNHSKRGYCDVPKHLKYSHELGEDFEFLHHGYEHLYLLSCNVGQDVESTDISEEYFASIFRVEQQHKQEAMGHIMCRDLPEAVLISLIL